MVKKNEASTKHSQANTQPKTVRRMANRGCPLGVKLTIIYFYKKENTYIITLT